jgi:hypothetical protein
MKDRIRSIDLAFGIFLGLITALLLMGVIAGVFLYYFPNLIMASPPPLPGRF